MPAWLASNGSTVLVALVLLVLVCFSVRQFIKKIREKAAADIAVEDAPLQR